MKTIEVMARAQWAGFRPALLAGEVRSVASDLRFALATTGVHGREHVTGLTMCVLFDAALRLSASLPMDELRAQDGLLRAYDEAVVNGAPQTVADLIVAALERQPPHADVTDEAAAMFCVVVVAACIDFWVCLDDMLERFEPAKRSALRGLQ